MSSCNFKISVFFLILLIKGCFAGQNESSLIPAIDNEIESRIAGGFRPPVHILPKYCVSLRRNNPNDKFGYTHFCAGSIISPDKILTAAHCLVDMRGRELRPSTILVVAKTPIRLTKTKHTQEVNVKQVIVHQNFSKSKLYDDIGILVLEEDIKLDNQLAAQIFLPKRNIKHEEICTVIGWGRLYMNGPMANHILYVDMPVHSTKHCRKFLPMFTSMQVCAGDEDDLEKDACTGDSGGPLLCNGILTGIVSYGYGCASGRPGVYTNVFKYMDWIARGRGNALKSFTVIQSITWLLIVVST